MSFEHKLEIHDDETTLTVTVGKLEVAPGRSLDFTIGHEAGYQKNVWMGREEFTALVKFAEAEGFFNKEDLV